MTILLTNLFLHSIHTLLKQYSGSIQGNVSLLTLATPWVHLGYTLGRVCEIRHKSIKNPSNRKRKIDISTDEHIRNYQNWLIVARASRVTHRRSQEDSLRTVPSESILSSHGQAPGYGCLFSWQFFCYIPDGLVIHASNS